MQLPSKLIYIVCNYTEPYLIIIPLCYSRLLHVFGVYMRVLSQRLQHTSQHLQYKYVKEPRQEVVN